MRLSTAYETLVRPAPAWRTGTQVGPRARTAATAQLTVITADALTLTLAVAAATWGARGTGLDVSTVWAVVTGLVVACAYAAGGLYAPRLRRDLLDDGKIVVVQTALGAALVLAAQALLIDDLRTDAVLRAWAFATVFVILGRATVHSATVSLWRSGVGLRPVLIVGAGRVGRLVATRLMERPEYGLRPVGFLDKEPRESDPDSVTLPVLGASWDLEDVIAEHGVQEVVIAFSSAPSDVVVRVAERCGRLGVPVTVVPRVFEKTTARIQAWHLGGLPLLSARAPDPKGGYFAVKYVADRIIATFLVVAAAPVLLAVAAAVALSLGRPILFRQTRIGRDGQTFDILKFRTMRVSRNESAAALDALPEGLAPGGVEGDDRRTRVGAFLRRTSLDELPQLLNVVKGEMSLVGPRPERPEFVSEFNGRVYRYADRHRVKSGITGWAQVNGLRGKTPIADRAEWDNYYIENFSFWLDLKILLLTVTSVLRMARTVE